MFSKRPATQHVSGMPAPRHAAPIALVLLIAVSTGVRFWAARGMDLPWIAPDETIYALLGRSLWEDGSPSLLGAPGRQLLVHLPRPDRPAADSRRSGHRRRSSPGPRSAPDVGHRSRRVPLGTRPARGMVGGGGRGPDSGRPGPRVLGFPHERGRRVPGGDAGGVGDRGGARSALTRAAGSCRDHDRSRSGDARPARGADPDAVRGRRSPMRLRAVARAGATPDRPPGRHRGRVRRHARGLRGRRALARRLRRVRRGRGRLRARRRGDRT